MRMLCGIALCNSFVPARFTASLAIIMCKHWVYRSGGYATLSSRVFFIANLCALGGSWCTDRAEQEVLIDFMQGTEQCSGWPRKAAQKILIQDWGWSKDD